MSKRTNGNQLPANSFSGLVDQLFETNLKRVFDDSQWGFNGKISNAQVPVNIHETDKSFELELVAPGCKKENFKIDVSGDTLTIAFDHSDKNEHHDGDRYVHQEYRQTSFTRSFNLDDTIDTNKIGAKYQDGLLYLTLPKKEGAQKIAKSIPIE